MDDIKAPVENIQNNHHITSSIIEMGNQKAAYFKLLEEWVNTANLHMRANAFFPYYMMMASQSQMNAIANNNVPSVNQQNTRPNIIIPPVARLNFQDPARAEAIIRENGGWELIISPFWKRFLAEVIDIVIAFIWKLLVLNAVVNILNYDIGIDLSFSFLDGDYANMLNASSDFLYLVIASKLLGCLFEATLTYNLRATPGKLIMGLRIMSCDACIALEPEMNNRGIRALIYPATGITYERALCRAILKSILVATLFPMYFMIAYFKLNQTLYDISSRSIVVEFNPEPRYHRNTNANNNDVN